MLPAGKSGLSVRCSPEPVNRRRPHHGGDHSDLEAGLPEKDHVDTEKDLKAKKTVLQHWIQTTSRVAHTIWNHYRDLIVIFMYNF